MDLQPTPIELDELRNRFPGTDWSHQAKTPHSRRLSASHDELVRRTATADRAPTRAPEGPPDAATGTFNGIIGGCLVWTVIAVVYAVWRMWHG